MCTVYTSSLCEFIVAANGMACHASSVTKMKTFMVRCVYALCSQEFVSVYTHTQMRTPIPVCTAFASAFLDLDSNVFWLIHNSLKLALIKSGSELYTKRDRNYIDIVLYIVYIYIYIYTAYWVRATLCIIYCNIFSFISKWRPVTMNQWLFMKFFKIVSIKSQINNRVSTNWWIFNSCPMRIIDN